MSKPSKTPSVHKSQSNLLTHAKMSNQNEQTTQTTVDDELPDLYEVLESKVHKPLRDALRVQLKLPAAEDWPAWLETMNQLTGNEEALNFEEAHRAMTDKSPHPGDKGDPMELDAMNIGGKRKRKDVPTPLVVHRMRNGLCITCGKPGYFAREYEVGGDGSNNGSGGGSGNRGKSGGHRGGYSNQGSQGDGRGWDDNGNPNGQSSHHSKNNAKRSDIPFQGSLAARLIRTGTPRIRLDLA
ncbi:hypothetical protein V8F06_013995 [Rhypophila decipiens]